MFKVWKAIICLLTLAVTGLPVAVYGGDDASFIHTSTAPGKIVSMYGRYDPVRDSGGTSWRPDNTPSDERSMFWGDWGFKAHGFINGVYGAQGGRQGRTMWFSTSLVGMTGTYRVNPGTLGLRAMISSDPFMGRYGYPMLFQTGGTGNGIAALINSQRPQDFYSELAAAYSFNIGDNGSGFLYFGLPGEPALGPVAYMRRWSGMEIPEAPLSFQWMDVTHITYGVATAGYVWQDFKVEYSYFNGREPDDKHWEFDRVRFDSKSVRLSYNRFKEWAFQVSGAFVNSPETQYPQIDLYRYTASATYGRPAFAGYWQTTLAWGLNSKISDTVTNAFLLESSANVIPDGTAMARLEFAQKDELYQMGDPMDGIYGITKLTAGYVHEIASCSFGTLGLGGTVSLYLVPEKLASTYSRHPGAAMLFARAKLK